MVTCREESPSRFKCLGSAQELVDTDDLLEEEDLKKPHPDSLKSHDTCGQSLYLYSICM